MAIALFVSFFTPSVPVIRTLHAPYLLFYFRSRLDLTSFYFLTFSPENVDLPIALVSLSIEALSLRRTQEG
jgi:hypothetical protein